ncbi:MAG TPA: methionine synthase [Chloroflexi bacterium]|nr:methionine synthase [Chloroflexota bacterium]
MSKELVNAIADMKEQEALKLAQEMLDGGSDPMEILGAAREAMGVVGRRYEEGSYFLPELILSGVMLNQIAEMVKPKLVKESEKEKRQGKVVIGTVEGDIHDIGKDIVVFMLDVNGFEVLDLGIDVPADKFVEAIKDFGPQVVGLSGFLTLAFDSMKDTVEAIKKAGLRDKVKIMIGGGQISDEIKKYTGADAYGKDAMAGVSLAKQWVGAK